MQPSCNLTELAPNGCAQWSVIYQKGLHAPSLKMTPNGSQKHCEGAHTHEMKLWETLITSRNLSQTLHTDAGCNTKLLPDAIIIEYRKCKRMYTTRQRDGKNRNMAHGGASFFYRLLVGIKETGRQYWEVHHYLHSAEGNQFDAVPGNLPSLYTD